MSFFWQGSDAWKFIVIDSPATRQSLDDNIVHTTCDFGNTSESIAVNVFKNVAFESFVQKNDTLTWFQQFLYLCQV